MYITCMGFKWWTQKSTRRHGLVEQAASTATL